MRYYEVGLGTEKHWTSSSFTYSDSNKLDVGSVVEVTFGTKKKTGVILSEVKKPSYKSKHMSKHLGVTLQDETLKFISWYQKYYASQGGQAFSQLLPHYLTKPKKNIEQQHKNSNSVSLTADQGRAKEEISGTDKPSVLHGITGSGKTRIYISLILDQLSEGKSSVLLYPEIALTPQIMQELEKHAQVLVFHSGITNAQRSKLWFEIATTSEPYIVIGARSALFLPHKNLGLVILDEAHEPSYKQDTNIRYNSIMTAGGLAQSHGAKLLLGSATPPITETKLILSKGGNLVCLHEKAIKTQTKKTVHVIDKKNKNLFKEHYLLSDALIHSMSQSLKKGKQSLLFINRRGTAKLMHCKSCDWRAECPNCDLPLTYHHDTHKLLCHTCGKNMPIVPMCPECSSDIQLKSFGSKAIVDEVQRIFTSAKIGRFDSDNKKDDSFASNYNAVKKGDVDILIGTQQLVKGLDLPLLATVGVLDADLSLYFPDYSSEERTFQLISQVAGRVGRGHTNGETFIQTYQTNNLVIQYAKEENWHEFYKRELELRKQHLFPPFVFTAKIVFRDKKLSTALLKADKGKQALSLNKSIIIDGPLPSYFGKRNGFYYIQLHLKSPSRPALLNSLSSLPKNSIYELDPLTLL